jgi:hypothetical protein
MGSRTDAYLIRFSLLVALGGLGCAELPLPSPLTSSDQQVQARQPPRSGTDAQPLRTASPGLVQSAADTAAPSPIPNDPAAKLHTLYREAAERYAKVDSYIVRLTRREQINAKDKPEEILLFKFRKEPWSVYFKWLGTESKGREVIYVRGHYENKIHTLLAAGDIPLMPAGKRFAVAPDSPFVQSSSRHAIHEAGIGVLIENFGKALDETDRNSSRPGPLKYLGPMQRREFATACEAVEQAIAAGAEPQLPRGGRRLWIFDAETKFPVLLVTHDDTGHEVEYYCYDRLEFPVHLDSDDFDPDKLWNPKREAVPQK